MEKKPLIKIPYWLCFSTRLPLGHELFFWKINITTAWALVRGEHGLIYSIMKCIIVTKLLQAPLNWKLEKSPLGRLKLISCLTSKINVKRTRARKENCTNVQIFPEFGLKRTRELMLNMKSVLTGLIKTSSLTDTCLPNAPWRSGVTLSFPKL